MHATPTTATGSTQHSRTEGPITDELQLHPAADGLRDAVGATQGLHLQGVLGLAPGEEAGFERVGGGGCCGVGVCGGGSGGGLLGDVVAEGVGEAWGGGGAFGWVREADGDGVAGCGV